MTGERLELTDVHSAFARHLRLELTARRLLGGERAVIGVAGESGSGKSISAVALRRELEAHGRSTIVLHQDDYFVRPPRANHAWRCADLARVGPHEVRLELLAAHIAAFRAGERDVAVPSVDYPSDSIRSRRLDFGPVDVLIVEGTYVLLLDDLDVRIFLEATHHETAARRRGRNRDADEPIIDRILAIEHDLVAPQHERAHMTIDRDFVVRR